jgi:signal transduction histidine kinase
VQLYLASLIALFGVAAYVALHDAWIGLRRREAGTHRVFAGLAGMTALYCLAIAAFAIAPQQAVDAGVESAWWICEMSQAALLMAFVARFTGQDHRRLRLGLTAGLGLFALAAVTLPDGLRSGPLKGLQSCVLPWGETLHVLDGPYGLAYFGMLALIAACFAFSGAAAWRAWRGSRSGRQLALLVSLALIALAVVNSVVADLTGRPTVPLIPHSFVLLAAIMGHVLSAELARAGELEARLRRAEQFAVVGRLAGGVAHDFGNILTGIVGHAELLADRLGEGTAERGQVAAIAAAAGRGTALTRQLLAFARGSPAGGSPSGTDAHAVIGEVAGLIRAGAAGIEVRLDLAQDEAPVACDPARLHAALLNLAVNARDAMPHGGVLRLSTARRGPPAGAALRHAPSPGPLLEIAVGDSGQGIPGDVLPHIFDLQYTTKGGLGTGLGLPQVDELVRDAGGCLAVETIAGRGTTFRLWLPLQDKVGSGLHAPQGSRVLLVAGNTTLDQMLASGLGQLGYDIARLGQDDRSRLRAAVVDIDHAGSDGLARVRALQEHLPVVVLADDPGQWGAGDTTVVLPKPADLAAIGRALRKATASGRLRSDPAV